MGDETQHLVIVGGSAAGISAALALRRHGFAGRVTVVEAGDELPYERPPLSKALAGGEHAFLHAILPRQAYAEQRITLLPATRVLALDPDRRAVELDDGQTLYADRVLLATGVLARTLPVPGAELPGVLTLRDVRDARALAARLRAGGPVVVVGGGFIGLEVAAVAREAGLDVTVVETGAQPLAGPLGPVLASRVTALHERAGVRLLTSVSVTAFTGTTHVTGVRLTDGRMLPAATVVVGVGVRPDTALAEAAGVLCEDGIVVDRHCHTSVPWILAAGDATNQPHPHLPARGRIEHWDNAVQQGAVAGAVLAGVPESHTALPYFYSEQYGRTLQMYGRPAPGDEFVLRVEATNVVDPVDPAEAGGPADGGFLGFWTRAGVLIAAAGLDRPRELRAARALIERRLPVDAAALASPTTDLRALAKPSTAPGPLAARLRSRPETRPPHTAGTSIASSKEVP
ncbi:NAD(P)/FAD-dependent oxidoreductase [Embleya sp. NPDC020886]|uniref:NAD(P)/FAD-dependent oxidoreductase n=1 Tax=Embleya sp. NPDC020886 TaxID=3363980 RepID=UPI003799C6B1